MSEVLLSVRDLKTYFYTEDGVVPAVDGVSFDVHRGGTLGIVGESGCGKSVTSLSIMRLVQSPPGRITNGQILFEGRDLLQLSDAEMRKIRGNEISMIFQEPMTSLNPVFTIGNQIMEAIILHQKLDKAAARRKAVEMLSLVGIPSPEKRIDEYPHQLSGGMRQRVMIAMALSCNPKLLIADEPTTALDVTIEAQILDLMRELQQNTGTAIIMITHDLGVIAEMVDNVVVMYTGIVVESADTKTLFTNPKHPYTEGLLGSIPRLDKDVERLQAIPGTVPLPGSIREGCGFYPRCPYAKELCTVKRPPAFEVGPGHHCACWRLVDYQDVPTPDKKEVV
jgi:oligopeptide/dipeptide ABC transporter ATP-binding protein